MSRKRWAYTMGGQPLSEPMEVSEDYRGGGGHVPVVSDAYMDGARSPIDGSDIGSRAKRKAHMRAHGLVDADDYKGEWARKAEQRAEFRRTGDDGKDWGGRIATTLNQMQQGRRR